MGARDGEDGMSAREARTHNMGYESEIGAKSAKLLISLAGKSKLALPITYSLLALYNVRYHSPGAGDKLPQLSRICENDACFTRLSTMPRS